MYSDSVRCIKQFVKTIYCFRLLISAFAELQTEVIDFTSDLNVIGIPVWDYQTYTFKVLFPSYADHPVFHENVCQV